MSVTVQNGGANRGVSRSVEAAQPDLSFLRRFCRLEDPLEQPSSPNGERPLARLSQLRTLYVRYYDRVGNFKYVTCFDFDRSNEQLPRNHVPAVALGTLHDFYISLYGIRLPSLSIV